MKRILIAILLVHLIGCASFPNRKEMVYVGFIERDCSTVRNRYSIVTIPVGFKLTPVEAAKSIPRGCAIKFSYSVYADIENYYFANNNLLFFKSKNAKNIRKYSYIVNANTGELIGNP